MTTIKAPVRFVKLRSPYSQVGEVSGGALLKMGGKPGPSGKVFLYGSTGDLAKNDDAAVKILGWNGSAIFGGGIERRAGRISILAGTGHEVISLGAAAGFKMAGRISLRESPNGPETASLHANGVLTLGANGKRGVVRLYRAGGDRTKPSRATVDLDGEQGNLKLGGGAVKYEYREPGDFEIRGGVDGDIGLWPSSALDTNDWNKASIHLSGEAGDIIVRDGEGKDVFRFNAKFAVLDIGAAGNEGDIRVRDNAGKTRIHLDGNTGDIKMMNADCAEEFDISGNEKIEPGTVMVIDREDQLRQSTKAYDKTVAGVISGAGDYRPGIVLDSKQSQNGRMPVAVMGKVYCKADIQNGPIEAGDLLTTSSTPGHAMKAVDPLKAFGAVIGKALRPLKEGTGLIPILVALQ